MLKQYVENFTLLNTVTLAESHVKTSRRVENVYVRHVENHIENHVEVRKKDHHTLRHVSKLSGRFRFSPSVCTSYWSETYILKSWTIMKLDIDFWTPTCCVVIVIAVFSLLYLIKLCMIAISWAGSDLNSTRRVVYVAELELEFLFWVSPKATDHLLVSNFFFSNWETHKNWWRITETPEHYKFTDF